MNIEKRIKKIKQSTMAINTLTKAETIKTIESGYIIKFYEMVNISKLLYNSESWTITNEEKTNARTNQNFCS